MPKTIKCSKGLEKQEKLIQTKKLSTSLKQKNYGYQYLTSQYKKRPIYQAYLSSQRVVGIIL